ncbi:MAG: transcription termination factor NusA [Candidatus Curtissbacteria bacterium]|nr:transcription termination factor NusA [Candidatus Curtissbacteria bacterium]
MAIQARTEFASALNQVCSERGVEPEVVIDSIKQAILAAYRKDYSDPEGIDVELDSNTGEVALKKGKKDVTPAGFGRIAAQTAKQVILQRIREAEKNAIMEEYSAKIDTVVSGIIQRISGPIITVNLGKAEGIMPPPEQSHSEHYLVNQRLKFYVVGIKEGPRGEEIIVSRSAPGLLAALFKQEVPEISSASVEIKAIAREGGSRSKIAVASSQMGVDPVGSCVGQKGVRVQAVMNELGDEKIDIIAYQEDPAEFIKAALSPAKELQVTVNEEEKTAVVTAPDDQLSLAIGREGQNVRLAAKLTGYKIDIQGKSGSPREVEAKEKAAQEEAKKALGVTEPKKPKEAEKSMDQRETKAPKEAGTEETTSAAAEPAAQPAPPGDDKAQPEPKTSDESETSEDSENQKTSGSDKSAKSESETADESDNTEKSDKSDIPTNGNTESQDPDEDDGQKPA